VLRDMPAVWKAVAHGTVGWGELRTIVWEASRLSKAQRRALDSALDAQMGTFADCEADVVLRAVDEAIAMLQPDEAEKDDKTSFERRFLHAQLGLDGSASLYGELDAEAATPILDAVDRLASLLPDHLDPDQIHHHTSEVSGNGLDDGATGCDCGARGGRLTV
jgi:hypothetical protein